MIKNELNTQRTHISDLRITLCLPRSNEEKEYTDPSLSVSPTDRAGLLPCSRGPGQKAL